MQVKPLIASNLNPGMLFLEQQKDLNVYIANLLSQVNSGQALRPNQKLKITAYSDHLPFVYKTVEIAYRDFNAGLVSVSLKEQALEDLKARYGIREDFDYKEQKELELKQQGAAFITFDKTTSLYSEAGLSAQDEKDLIKSISDFIPDDVQKELAINPEEILSGCLNLRRGQPLAILGSREHLPQMLQLAEWAYQNGTKLIDISINEKKEFDLAIPFYKYASKSILSEVPESVVARSKEFLEKGTASLYLEGTDPSKYENIDPAKIQLAQTGILKKTKPYEDRLTIENPWCIYYLPTTASAGAAGYASLKDAAIEARKITRVGKLTEHIANLKKTEEKLNAVVKQGYNILHFLSVRPNTETPDGKTDLRVGLTPKSIFISGTAITPSGQVYIPNIPTEECFTTPDWTKTKGTVSMTRPVSLNGSIVDGIQMEFNEGKLIKANATKNPDVLLEWLEKNENADKLGEIAVVAGSPIFDLGKIFNSILLDENATCHFALGNSYSDCIEGTNDIANHDEREIYMRNLSCNNSPVHIDFMIGGPNVMVFAEKVNGSDRKVLIKDNKFQI
ncbi:MAG: aminopeptidase [Candidatus Melainabacteria bacterium]|nr:aminopeptidase [Candidatus Melainabacteria bacterium]